MPMRLFCSDIFDFIYVLEGKASCQAGDLPLTFTKGDLCLIPPGCLHGVSAGEDDLVLRLLVSRRQMENVFCATPHGSDAVTDFLRAAIYLDDYPEHLLFHTEGDEEIRDELLDMYVEEFQPDGFSQQILPHMMMVFFVHLKRKYKLTAEHSSHALPDEDTSRILRYIQEDYASASLAGLADMLGYSVPYCSRFVRENTGLGFSELLKRTRLARAADYLQNTDLSVTQISERIGYENPENFMRMFKKEYGMSPTQFRVSGKLSA